MTYTLLLWAADAVCRGRTHQAGQGAPNLAFVFFVLNLLFRSPCDSALLIRLSLPGVLSCAGICLYVSIAFLICPSLFDIFDMTFELISNQTPLAFCIYLSDVAHNVRVYDVVLLKIINVRPITQWHKPLVSLTLILLL